MSRKERDWNKYNYHADPEKQQALKGVGYDEYALRGVIMMRGHRYATRYIAELTGLSKPVVVRNLKSGEWKRSSMNAIVEDLELDDDEIRRVFFTGENNTETTIGELRNQYSPANDKETSVADKLDRILGAVKEFEEE